MISLPNTDGIESSYKQNNYGLLLYTLVKLYKPRLVVELGAYQGYSGLHIAAAMRDNAVPEHHFAMVDLWNQYAFKHCSIDAIKDNFNSDGLLDKNWRWINFIEQNAMDAAKLFRDGSIDMLHIDISNDGVKLHETFSVWEPKLADGAIIIVEGGSFERDHVAWMKEFKKPGIGGWLDVMAQRYMNWTFDPFPSVTLLRKKV